MNNQISVLLIGDIVGKTGVELLVKELSLIKTELNADAVVVNAENSADQGKGISPRVYKKLKQLEIDVFTSGNHIWKNRDIFPVLNEKTILLRPENYPSTCPGTGIHIFNKKITFLLFNFFWG